MAHNLTGKRKYECADCGRTQFLHWEELSRRCKPRCAGCGGTFFNPVSEGACEQEVNAGTARAIKDSEPPKSGRDGLMMQGNREVPKSRS